MRLYRLLKKPIVTEKTSNMSLQKNVYVFEVDSVNIVNTREKVRFGRKGGIQLRKRAWKKAYVTLKNPQDKIDYTILK